MLCRRNALITGEGFQPHPHQQQRLLYEERAIIDLVPFGNLELATGLIVWPPDFAVEMSTVGFREAYDSSMDVRLADDLVVKVASLVGLALLKIVAWSDRRFERDAQDFGLIMRNYLDAGNQGRLYDADGDCADLLSDEFDYEKASARVLERDIGRILEDGTHKMEGRLHLHYDVCPTWLELVQIVFAISRYLQNAFASSICRGVLH